MKRRNEDRHRNCDGANPEQSVQPSGRGSTNDQSEEDHERVECVSGAHAQQNGEVKHGRVLPYSAGTSATELL